MYTPLDIVNTPNCLPSPWHPSVVFVAEGWNGHPYWMAQTPFPNHDMEPYRDRYELPCVHYSDDGIHWSPIPNNPIVELTDVEIAAHEYYSDPHLVFKNGVLELYYRFTILQAGQLVGNKTLLLRSVSHDGYNWSEPQTIADLRKIEDIAVWGEQIISQALCWDEHRYRCWYVDKSSYLHSRNIRIVTSVDGVEWTKSKLCSIDGPAMDPWHIDVQYYDGKYQMIVYDMWRLRWYESEDGLHFRFVSDILQPSSKPYHFYAGGLYRACSVKTDTDIRVYFSAEREDQSYIGLLSTTDRLHFRPVSGVSSFRWIPLAWKSLIAYNWKRIKKGIKRVIK